MGDGIAQNVRVGAVGAIFSGPLSGTVPANYAAAINPSLATNLLADGMAQAGYVSKDGVTQSIGTSTSKITAWGGDIVRIVQTEHSVTYKYKVIETNLATLQEYYGDDATSQEVQITGASLPHKRRVIIVRDGNSWITIVLADSQVIDRSDIQYYADDAVGYELTVEALPDANGVKAQLYLGDVTFAAPTIGTLTPSTGPAAGATEVMIAGTGFLGVQYVRFGGVAALAFNVDSSTQITAFTPAHAIGAVDVAIKTSGGVVTKPAAYTYA